VPVHDGRAALDLVVVRLGKSPAELKQSVIAYLAEIVDCFRATDEVRLSF
jgi:hypothetical protein